MAIENDLHVPDAHRHVRVGLASELGLGLVAGTLFAVGGLVLMAVGQHEFGICFLALAPWLPFLLAQDYWRWMGFMDTRPGKALTNDVVFDAVQVVAFLAVILLGARSPVMAIGAWGISAAAAAAFGLWQFSTRPSLRGGFGRIRSRWHMSQWLVAANGTASVQQQATVLLTGRFVGPTGIGGLKAATNLVSGPSFVLIQAGDVGLPEASKALKDHGWAGLQRVQRLVTTAGMVSVGLIALVVFLFGRQLLEAIYGHAFGQFAPVADILAVRGVHQYDAPRCHPLPEGDAADPATAPVLHRCAHRLGRCDRDPGPGARGDRRRLGHPCRHRDQGPVVADQSLDLVP